MQAEDAGQTAAAASAATGRGLAAGQHGVHSMAANRQHSGSGLVGMPAEEPASSSWAALMAAAKSGNAGTVRQLLDSGAAAHLDAQLTVSGWSALHAAASLGHAAVVAELLQRGAAVDLVDRAGKTSLMLAATNGHAAVVRLLLSGGAAADFGAPLYNSALPLAVAGVVDHSVCSSPQSCCSSRFSPFAKASRESGERAAIVHMLLQAGASVDGLGECRMRGIILLLVKAWKVGNSQYICLERS